MMYVAHTQASCRDGDIKLVNGKTENEGRVLICLDQRWGTVNVNGWSDVDTEVACRQLGYSSAGTYVRMYNPLTFNLTWLCVWK